MQQIKLKEKLFYFRFHGKRAIGATLCLLSISLAVLGCAHKANVVTFDTAEFVYVKKGAMLKAEHDGYFLSKDAFRHMQFTKADSYV